MLMPSRLFSKRFKNSLSTRHLRKLFNLCVSFLFSSMWFSIELIFSYQKLIILFFYHMIILFFGMKINRHGKAKILIVEEIQQLFNEGFHPRCLRYQQNEILEDKAGENLENQPNKYSQSIGVTTK